MNGTGKKPLKFETYRWLSKKFLLQGEAFGHLFTLLSWNLMCRASNTVNIHGTHIEWIEDSLAIWSLFPFLLPSSLLPCHPPPSPCPSPLPPLYSTWFLVAAFLAC